MMDKEKRMKCDCGLTATESEMLIHVRKEQEQGGLKSHHRAKAIDEKEQKKIMYIVTDYCGEREGWIDSVVVGCFTTDELAQSFIRMDCRGYDEKGNVVIDDNTSEPRLKIEPLEIDSTVKIQVS